MNSKHESPLTFPTEFPIKAMGLASPAFEALVIEIIRRHAPDLGESAVYSRASKSGKYLSVTVTIQAASLAQLDAIYRDLSACPEILWAL